MYSRPDFWAALVIFPTLIFAIAAPLESRAALVPVVGGDYNLLNGYLVPEVGSFNFNQAVTSSGFVDTNTLQSVSLSVAGSTGSYLLHESGSYVFEQQAIVDPPGFDPPYSTTVSADLGLDFSATVNVVIDALSFPSLSVDPYTLRSVTFVVGSVSIQSPTFSFFVDQQLVQQQIFPDSAVVALLGSVQCQSFPNASCAWQISPEPLLQYEHPYDVGIAYGPSEIFGAIPKFDGIAIDPNFSTGGGLQIVPEPSTALLMGIGLAALSVRRRL